MIVVIVINILTIIILFIYVSIERNLNPEVGFWFLKHVAMFIRNVNHNSMSRPLAFASYRVALSFRSREHVPVSKALVSWSKQTLATAGDVFLRLA